MRLDTPKDVEGLVTLLPGDLQQLGPVDMMQVLFVYVSLCFCVVVSLCLQQLGPVYIMQVLFVSSGLFMTLHFSVFPARLEDDEDQHCTICIL